ncbi:inorganic diphosphatase [Flavobacteriaceae bacterium]|nr:inorganic diphosphatase [Flavobacteriaceae bacterium]
MIFRILISFIACFLVFSCSEKLDYYNLSPETSNNIFKAVIEIPAGTNKKYEYNKKTKTFEIDKRDGQDRIIKYLPYVGNYGFIPSTYSDPKKGGDGDALDVLILSESIPTGTVVEIRPIAMLKLIDDGEIDYKIIAIPNSEKQQILKVTNYKEFSDNFPEIKTIIELWFLNYNKIESAKIEGWVNEKKAIHEIYENKLK